MLKKIKADLHIHTCLSPCGDIRMTAKTIVESAISRKLDMIGICDHNATENFFAVRKAAEKFDLKVIGGIEVTSIEEVHILALFDDDSDLFKFQKIVYENLEGENDEELFGFQLIINEQDEIIDLNKKLLIGATSLSVDNIAQQIHSLNGVVIASHIDRERFSLIGQLGFVPEGLELDGLELSPRYISQNKKLEYPLTADSPFITFSDSHYPEDIGKTSTCFYMEDANIKELKKALKGQNGRYIITYS